MENQLLPASYGIAVEIHVVHEGNNFLKLSIPDAFDKMPLRRLKFTLIPDMPLCENITLLSRSAPNYTVFNLTGALTGLKISRIVHFFYFPK